MNDTLRLSSELSALRARLGLRQVRCVAQDQGAREQNTDRQDRLGVQVALLVSSRAPGPGIPQPYSHVYRVEPIKKMRRRPQYTRSQRLDISKMLVPRATLNPTHSTAEMIRGASHQL